MLNIKKINSNISTLFKDQCVSFDDDELTTNWLEKNFPIASWSRIDWDKVDRKIVRYCENDDAICDAVLEFLNMVNDTDVIIC